MEFIFFGNDWFAENRTSSHHISKRLASKFPLLYVEVPGLRAPGANARDLWKLVRKLRRTFQPPQAVGSQSWLMTLPQIPLQRIALVRALNRLISRFLIRRAIRRLGLKDTVAWFHVPHAGFLAKHLGEKLTVFYCIDDYSKLPGVDGATVQTMDRELTSAADIVFTCNTGLMEARRSLNPNIHVSPHGVDTELFAHASSPDVELPEATRSLSRPIVGSWGLLDLRVDLSIIAQIARARPNWTILLIGRIAVDVSVLRAIPNIVFAGVRPYQELPRWAKAIDVCILPYTRTSLNAQSSPLKLREYLASGKPIVAVPIPEAQLLGDAIQIGEDGPGFVRAIEESLALDSPQLAAMRQKAVAGNTWDATVDNILEKLENEIAKSGTRVQMRASEDKVSLRNGPVNNSASIVR